MGINMKNGTPMHGPSLCETCTRAHVVRGYRTSEEFVICQATYPERRVPFRVYQCTDYLDRTRQNLKQMQDIAWLLAPRGSKRAGFVPPSEMPNDEDELELTLD